MAFGLVFITGCYFVLSILEHNANEASSEPPQAYPLLRSTHLHLCPAPLPGCQPVSASKDRASLCVRQASVTIVVAHIRWGRVKREVVTVWEGEGVRSCRGPLSPVSSTTDKTLADALL